MVRSAVVGLIELSLFEPAARNDGEVAPISGLAYHLGPFRSATQVFSRPRRSIWAFEKPRSRAVQQSKVRHAARAARRKAKQDTSDTDAGNAATRVHARLL